ncbi:MAG: HIT domain-containing protein [Alphaproteobacteria bacterium]|nr:HIT domain-containing protein [Alphaproteobacteria bacterium]
MHHDPNNIFAKILRGEIPCKKISEDSYYCAFFDVHPKATVHALIIPTGNYSSFLDFTENATNDEIIGFYKGVASVAAELGLQENGFRLISNCGPDGGQEVPHFHIHILGGEKLGRLR